jgi:hypothetical protein
MFNVGKAEENLRGGVEAAIQARPSDTPLLYIRLILIYRTMSGNIAMLVIITSTATKPRPMEKYPKCIHPPLLLQE